MVDTKEGFTAGLVELLLVVTFEEWPPDPEGFISYEDAQEARETE